MSLRKRLREAAETDLDDLISRLQEAALDLTSQYPNNNYLPQDLLKLAAGGRTDTVRTKVVTVLMKQKEAELVKFFENNQQLLLDPKPKAKDK